MSRVPLQPAEPWSCSRQAFFGVPDRFLGLGVRIGAQSVLGFMFGKSGLESGVSRFVFRVVGFMFETPDFGFRILCVVFQFSSFEKECRTYFYGRARCSPMLGSLKP